MSGLPRIYRATDKSESMKKWIALSEQARGARVTYRGRIWRVEGSVWLRVNREGEGDLSLTIAAEVGRLVKNKELYLLNEAETQIQEYIRERKEEVTMTRLEFLASPEGKKCLEQYPWLTEWKRGRSLEELVGEKVIISNEKLPDGCENKASGSNVCSNTQTGKDGTFKQSSRGSKYNVNDVPDLPS